MIISIGAGYKDIAVGKGSWFPGEGTGSAELGTAEEISRNPDHWHLRKMETPKQRYVTWGDCQSRAEYVWTKEETEAPPVAAGSVGNHGNIGYRTFSQPSQESRT